MTVRRIVAANRDGRSTVISDDTGLSNAFAHVPGFDPVLVWQTHTAHGIHPATSPVTGQSVVPSIGGTSMFVVTFPPDSVMTAPEFDPQAAGAEYGERLPGLAELFEAENPGMHTSHTVDYDIVIDGELWCELDDGEVHLKVGDVLIQHGTRHAWRNRGDKPATVMFVLLGIPPG